MNILIIGLNYAPEPIGIAVYTTGLAEALAKRGHDVRVISGQPYYPGWSIMKGYCRYRSTSSVENGVSVLRVPHYVPSEPTGPRRILHHLSFLASSLLPALRHAIISKPALVIAIAPSLMAAPTARAVARLCGARSWLHIQDFEIDAAAATGLVSGNGRMVKAALWLETKIVSGFDTVSTISLRMMAKLADKGVAAKRIRHFPNWATVNDTPSASDASPYRDEWEITTRHVALYSGALGNKQGLDIIIAAARALQERRDLTFIICGNGPNRQKLETQAQGLANIRFFDLQPPERLAALLALATIHLLPQRADAADLVLPSKLANMLASGRPIVTTAADGTGLAEAIEGCGVIIEPQDASAFATAIAALADDAALAAKLGAAARHRAGERWDRAAILNRTCRQIERSAMALPDCSADVTARPVDV